MEHSSTIKRLIYQSCHRGCKETDFLLSDYAKEIMPNFSEEQVDLYDSFLKEDDWDIYNWLIGKVTAPDKYNEWLIGDIRKYCQDK